MRGKIKYIRRNVWYVGNQAYHWSSDFHDVRCTRTFAMLYSGDGVIIDEDDIRNYYGRSRITDGLIQELNQTLHNVWIEYYEGEGGDYYLDGEFSDYI